METNVEFIKEILKNSKFQNAEIHTGFIEENRETLLQKIQMPDEILMKAALGMILCEKNHTLKKARELNPNDPLNPFVTLTGFRVNHFLKRRFEFLIDQEKQYVDVIYDEADVFSMMVNDCGTWKIVKGTLKDKKSIMEMKSDINGAKDKTRYVIVDYELFLFTKVSFFFFLLFS